MKINIPTMMAADQNTSSFNLSVRKVSNGLIVDLNSSASPMGGVNEQLVVETSGKTAIAVKTAIMDLLSNSLITVAEPVVTPG